MIKNWNRGLSTFDWEREPVFNKKIGLNLTCTQRKKANHFQNFWWNNEGLYN